ncbi:Alanine--tRNA ligase [Forsythia ovata]|uniref:Alanine--tRNA ligase n=1 Tax=Forsythia ovata TaxID=205694 RepID=A0ABD1RK01_9LAMI
MRVYHCWRSIFPHPLALTFHSLLRKVLLQLPLPPRLQPIRSPLPASASPSPSFNIVWHTRIRLILRRSISYCSSSSREEALLELSMGSQATKLEWPTNRVRDTFIKFFEDKGHVHWTSSPVVPHNDLTLLFANATLDQSPPKSTNDTLACIPTIAAFVHCQPPTVAAVATITITIEVHQQTHAPPRDLLQGVASTSSKGNTVTQSNINHASESLIQAREEAHYHMFNYSQDAQYQPYLPGYGDNLVPSYGSSHPFMSMNPLVQQPEEQMSRNLLANPTFHLPHNHYDR